jgi:hypothetical protein
MLAVRNLCLYSAFGPKETFGGGAFVADILLRRRIIIIGENA